MKVKIKKTHPNAKEPFKKYKEDFCYDLYAVSCEELAPNVWKYGLGLAFEIDREEYKYFISRKIKYCENMCGKDEIVPLLSLDFRPRSSVWKTGMVLSNCQGTVDELFRGETSAVFYHVMPNMPKYEIGDRVIQCKIGLTLPIEWEETEELSETERGENGYGHTGK